MSFTGTQSKPGLAGNILVNVVNVGVRMMKRIVLRFPVFHVAPNQKKACSKQAVNPFLIGKRPVISVVHNAHTYARFTDTHQYNQPQHGQWRKLITHNQAIWNQHSNQHYNAFNNHTACSLPYLRRINKIGIDTFP